MNKDERNELQNVYIKKMVEYLPLLRAAAKITQNQLSKKIGITRGTMVAIESGKRPLQWYLYLAMVTVFKQNNDSSKALINYEVYDESFLKNIE